LIQANPKSSGPVKNFSQELLLAMRCARRAARGVVACLTAFVVLALYGCGVPPDPTREQPRLSAYAQRFAPELREAGITKIVSWSDRIEQPVQVRSAAGPLYFPYDIGVPLARFALNVDGGRIQVLADDYDDANFDRYTQTMSWVIRRAVELARTNNARAAQREKASP
jgi:hypothetical protein